MSVALRIKPRVAGVLAQETRLRIATERKPRCILTRALGSLCRSGSLARQSRRALDESRNVRDLARKEDDQLLREGWQWHDSRFLGDIRLTSTPTQNEPAPRSTLIYTRRRLALFSRIRFRL